LRIADCGLRIKIAPLMPITAGARLGPYEIPAPLGAGGMGEIYRARDAKLNRDRQSFRIPHSAFRND